MTVEIDLLSRAGVAAADGRPIFAYSCTDPERARLSSDLRLRLELNPQHPVTARRFVLWAAEEIRTQLPPGGLTWAWLFGRLGRGPDGALGRELTLEGFAWWRRPIRRSDDGNRLLLYSLMAEGGLPDAYLAEAARYRDTVLAVLSEIEAEGALGPAIVERAACRRMAGLPQTFQHEDTARLLADLALALAAVRKLLPADLPAEAAEPWLDAQAPGWRDSLPLRLSPATVEALVRPALRAARGEAARLAGPICRRELRRRADATGWVACAIIGDGSLLAARFLEDVDPGLRLRLLPPAPPSGPAPSFLGVPEEGGWRLTRTGGTSEAVVHVPPDHRVALTAYADSRPVGEAVVDPGLPPPDLAPMIWRPTDPDEARPTRLEPVPGAARTRGPCLWLMTAADAEPEASAGLTWGEPEPVPGGRLWRLSGDGTVAVAGQSSRIVTGADSDAAAHALHAFGQPLRGWRSEDGRAVFVGQPELFGASASGVLHRLRNEVATRPVRERLCGYLAEWRSRGELAARIAYTALPEGLRIVVDEIGPGAVTLSANGLRPGWHLRLRAADAEIAAPAAADGTTRLRLSVEGQPPADLTLRLSDPNAGEAIELRSPWPARRGMIVGPDQRRLGHDLSLAVGALDGWRGIVPDRRQASLQLRFGASGPRVGLPVSGEVRLASVEPLTRTMLSLGGFDDEVRLRLIVDGHEGRKLILRRYADETRFLNGAFHGATGPWQLHAVAIDPPGEVEERGDVCGDLSLDSWLGGTDALWLVQARAADGTVARPFAWSRVPRVASTREARIAGYAAAMRDLLTNPADPGWEGSWRLFKAARDGGDAGALDQVQALAKVPAFAVALLFRVAEHEIAEALALEDATAIWWPASPLSAWADAIAAEHRRRCEALISAGFDAATSGRMSEEAMLSRAARLLVLRPELQGHLGAGLARSGLSGIVPAPHLPGGMMPLAVARPAERLDRLKQEVARRDPPLPEGTAGLRSPRNGRARGMPDHLRGLLDAPFVAAEIAAQCAPADLTTLLQLIALRTADPLWFDAALPAAIGLTAGDCR